MSNLLSKTKKIGYYAGLVFGIGYCLAFIGYLATFIEAWYIFYVFSPIATLMRTLSLTLILVGILCGVYFGITVIRNSKSARDSGLGIDKISSSVYTYSTTYILMGIGSTLLAAAEGLLDIPAPPPWGGPLPLYPFVAAIVGPILMFLGFLIYSRQSLELKSIGSVMMVISIVLIHFIGWNLASFTYSHLLLSVPILETISLLMLAGSAFIFAFPILRNELRHPAAGMIISISIMIFSAGVAYLNFSAITHIDLIAPRMSLGLLLALSWFPLSIAQAHSVWIMLSGFIILGIAGVIALIASCMFIVVSARQISTIRRREEVPEAPQET